MKDGRNIVGELSSEERAIIEKEYGPQKCFGSAARSKEQLASIHELTEKEMEFFGQDDSDSANLSVQMLYKFHGTFVPVRFTKELQSFVQDNPMLRPPIAHWRSVWSGSCSRRRSRRRISFTVI